jgi:Txe/YoeB family toxin of Txe-Axe toxin-antitoxin module
MPAVEADCSWSELGKKENLGKKKRKINVWKQRETSVHRLVYTKDYGESKLDIARKIW